MERPGALSAIDVSEAIAKVRDIMTAGDVILVKGSRVAGLETVVEAIA